jgi:hypothetical protein
MSVFDLFSRRQKRAKGGVPDVYAYDALPEKLRVQIVHILNDGLGTPQQYEGYGMGVYGCYEMVVEALCRELGVFRLPPTRPTQQRVYYKELFEFILTETNVESVLDAVELSFRAIDLATRNWDYANKQNASALADSAIDELNTRFQQHSVGYRFEAGEIIRIDSEVVHAEMVKPALALLQDSSYAGPEAEFRKAHEHYRHDRPKEALAECLKALESTMKAIAAKRKWAVDPKATAAPLVALMYDKGLIPAFWSTHFAGFTLHSGVRSSNSAQPTRRARPRSRRYFCPWASRRIRHPPDSCSNRVPGERRTGTLTSWSEHDGNRDDTYERQWSTSAHRCKENGMPNASLSKPMKLALERLYETNGQADYVNLYTGQALQDRGLVTVNDKSSRHQGGTFVEYMTTLTANGRKWCEWHFAVTRRAV